MSLTSWSYLLFFTTVFFLYYTVCKEKQIYLLLIASYLFYGMISLEFVILLVIITVVSFFSGVIISREKQRKDPTSEVYRKTIFILSITFIVLILCYFKYSTPITTFLHSQDARITINQVILPVGLSFYTFQTIGYIVDVYRGEIPAESNFVYYAACVSYFPHIMQGPIGKYQKLLPQMKDRTEFDYENSVFAVFRIVYGYFKKLVIANQISLVIDQVFARYSNYTGTIWWFALVLYSVQIYADFSGYMDIMIGCSDLLGIHIEKNFDRPYFSKSISEFWRKWHITLGQWFRNYLFYSLLRNNLLNGLRKKLKNNGKKTLANSLPTVLALIIVWVLIGAWHGAGLTFLLYGVYHGSFVIADAALGKRYSLWRTKNQVLSESRWFNCFRVARTFLIVTIGYSLFRAPSIHATGYILKNLFMKVDMLSLYQIVATNKKPLIAIMIGVLLLWANEFLQGRGISVVEKLRVLRPVFRYPVYIISVISILLLGAFGQSSFIYFGF